MNRKAVIIMMSLGTVKVGMEQHQMEQPVSKRDADEDDVHLFSVSFSHTQLILPIVRCHANELH